MGRTGNSKKDNTITIAVISTIGVIISAVFGYLTVVVPYFTSLHSTQTADDRTNDHTPIPSYTASVIPTSTQAIKTSQAITTHFNPSDGGALDIKNCIDWISCRGALVADEKFGPSDMLATYGSKYKGDYEISSIFLFFDTSNLPQNSTILKASLHLCSMKPMVPTPSASLGDGTIRIVQSQASDPFTVNDFNAIFLLQAAISHTVRHLRVLT